METKSFGSQKLDYENVGMTSSTPELFQLKERLEKEVAEFGNMITDLNAVIGRFKVFLAQEIGEPEKQPQSDKYTDSMNEVIKEFSRNNTRLYACIKNLKTFI